MNALIEKALRLAEPSNPATYRRYLEALPAAALVQKLADLEASGERNGAGAKDIFGQPGRRVLR